MSPADNAAKEPSMDEILASIRRIIEDNDSGQPSATTHEDVLAQVNNAFQAHDASSHPNISAVANKEYTPETPVSVVTSQPRSNDDAQNDLTEVPDTKTTIKLEPHQIAAETVETSHSDGDVFSSAINNNEAAVLDITAVEPDDAGTKLANMISDQAAERVSASFGALTDAVDANKVSQLEGMAEGMLKPMLQEWLDNNLPVIVERLVREEIERLARGEM